MNHIPDGERHRQAPDERYDALVDDFTRTLDLEAGLADATRPGRYSAMANDLSRLLDLDTGLTAILAPAETNTPPPLPAPSVEHDAAASDSYATRLSALLSSLEPPTRLRLRAGPRYARLTNAIQLALDLDHNLAGTLDLDHNLAGTLDRALDLARARALALAHDLARVRALAHAHDRALALAHDLDRARDHDRARALGTALGTALDRAHDLARDLIHAFAQEFDLDLDLTNVASPGPGDLSRLLRVLENVAVDFTLADLRAVSLVGVPLEGIRWSSATLWPPEWEEQIRAESIETDDGIFVIRGGGRRSAPVTV